MARRAIRAYHSKMLDRPHSKSLPASSRDIFVLCEAIAARGAASAGLAFRYGFHPTPFGEAVFAVERRGLAGLGFVDGDRETALADLRRRWPKAEFRRDESATAPFAERVFDPDEWLPDNPLRVALIGSDFDVAVWKALLTIEMGRTTTYGEIARRLGRPNAARAVGGAVGRNPVSFAVPCHRVLGAGGALGGYHWGLVRKRALLEWEER